MWGMSNMFSFTGTNDGGGATSNSWYSQNQNSSVLINNNNSAGKVVNSSDRIVANYRNDQDKKNYNESIDYLSQSDTFSEMYDKLEKTDEVFTVNFNDENAMYFDSNTKNIQYDPHSGLLIKSNNGIQSPSLGLAHEMGHAKQYLDGYLQKVNSKYKGPKNTEKYKQYKIKKIEEPNTKVEGKIAKDIGEPSRQNYKDTAGIVRRPTPTSSYKKEK
jgi:hypothetical protein